MAVKKHISEHLGIDVKTGRGVGAFSESKQRFMGVAMMLIWCVGLLTYRGYLTLHSHIADDKLSLGMIWNLFLAVVPLLWSLAFQSASDRKHPALSAVFFFLWLLFLPNAPYLITDLIHLHPSSHVPLWYLLAVLMSCAGAGTMLGYFSLIRVQAVIEQKYGKKTGWAVAVISQMLSAFGIYLGRCLHWNSWDVFVHPVQLLGTIAGQFVHSGSQPHPLAVTLIFGIGLLIGYVVVRVFSTSVHSRAVFHQAIVP